MSSAETFVTWENWQGREIWDFGGRGFCFIVFVLRLRPGADRAMFSGLLINLSTFCQNSIAASFESKLKPMTLLWSVLRNNKWWCHETFPGKFKTTEITHHLKGTLCEMLCQKPYNWTSCRLYLSTKRNMFHARLRQKLRAVNFDSLPSLYRTSAREHPCRSSANPSSLCLHTGLPAMNWCKSVWKKRKREIEDLKIIVLSLEVILRFLNCFENFINYLVRYDVIMHAEVLFFDF